MEELLKRANLKNTPQRREILGVLRESGEALTAEEIFLRCAPGEANLSTVYRTLTALVRAQVLVKAVEPDGAARYRLAGSGHCHRLVCLGCGREVEIPHCPLEALEAQLEETTGYTVTGHSLTFSGICPNCREKKGRE